MSLSLIHPILSSFPRPLYLLLFPFFHCLKAGLLSSSTHILAGTLLPPLSKYCIHILLFCFFFALLLFLRQPLALADRLREVASDWDFWALILLKCESATIPGNISFKTDKSWHTVQSWTYASDWEEEGHVPNRIFPLTCDTDLVF